MQIAFCHENVLPARGGAEMYVADLTRRLVAEGHDVHLYACRWDPAALPERVRVIPNAIDPARFNECDRPRLRAECRRLWGIGPGEAVAAFVAMNYRLKGLEPLLHAVARLPTYLPFRLLVAGSPRTAPWER